MDPKLQSNRRHSVLPAYLNGIKKLNSAECNYNVLGISRDADAIVDTLAKKLSNYIW